MIRRLCLFLLGLLVALGGVTAAFRFFVPDTIERWYLSTLRGERGLEDATWLGLIYLLTYLLLLNLSVLNRPTREDGPRLSK